MARFEVFALPRAESGLVVDVQADFLDELRTQVVVPLVRPERASQATQGLNPVVEVGDVSYVFAAQLITAIPARALQRRIADLASDRDAIHAPSTSC